ncbi:uncharacterized protein MELLADRAFT_90047 [Melampsora larici-populina 98AG31]|uniref:Uncharacterized protein n=1 Tax=Melampsora larici-populina (strain 98AG31 / pathotype 3-4-7) TaxID=747676 RepID=F4RVJ1_MELLP|nr:uncharacterized protein MELLADRAFT_90047 [Melampsora larici-populina 98AG31]EGG03658.1 hypothetical protein MELLADRAFT_90047 [Melampsora larici-populina 98AG31]
MSVQLKGNTALITNGKRIEKGFVEKPVSGKDHNMLVTKWVVGGILMSIICIYRTGILIIDKCTYS